MAGRTINASYPAGVVLAAGDNPLTITAAASITNAGAAAVQTAGDLDWVIDNAGIVAASGTVASSVGILLKSAAGSAGGTITNQATGAISGGVFGIYGVKNTTLTNRGSIQATNAASGVGVVIGTGQVSNLGGTIGGGRYGVYAIGAASITNTGGITGTADTGVVLNGGGSLANSGATGTITGQRHGAWMFGAGTVTNEGLVRATGTVGTGVRMEAGGRFENAVGGTVSGTLAGMAALGTAPTVVVNAGALQGTTYGAVVLSAAANVTNAATGAIVASRYGIFANKGGSIANAGSITGAFGIQMTAVAGTATNTGTIKSTGKFIGQPSEQVGAGIQLAAGGTIVNAAGGRVSGYWIGLQIGSFNGANPNGGTVLNAGVVTANDPDRSAGAAVWMKGAGLISNAATGTIAGGPYGIVSYDKVTIANRGVISGEQHAVFTSVAGNGDRIIVYPGASFSGTVLGDKEGVAVPTGVLELAGGPAAGAIAGFGSKYLGFASVVVDAGATWSVAGTVVASQTVALAGAGARLTLADPTAMAGVITGFNDTTGLVLGGVTDVTGTVLGASNVLTVSRASGGTIALRFDPAQSFPPGAFSFSSGAGGTTLVAPCFADGTLIATEHGPVAVGALRPGMRVVSALGGLVPVVWVGHRRVDCTRHPRPRDVWPVRVQAGAFGRGVPSRDLLLSPDHAVFTCGALVPVRHLVNGRTVRQEPADAVTYFHVELPAHDVLLAEGLACESYLDAGNRHAFANGGEAVMLHADFARRTWDAAACAPLVEDGPTLEVARQRLLVRAKALGARSGDDPGLAVMVGGRAVPLRIQGRRHEVSLPPGAAAVEFASRHWVPAHMQPEQDDHRALGVAIGHVALDGVALPLGDARFSRGWHAPEDAWRWSDGRAWLQVRGAATLAFDLMMTGLYWDARPEVRRASARS